MTRLEKILAPIAALLGIATCWMAWQGIITLIGEK